MVPKVLYRVIYGTPTPAPWQASLTTTRPAFLPGHQRRKVRYADYPGVIPLAPSSSNPAPTVRGTLVTGLTDGDIHRLDLFEGSEYERRKVRVQVVVVGRVDAAGVPGGSKVDASETEEIEAETYIWTAGEKNLEDREWDFDEFVREKLRFWVGGGADHEYADVDAAVAAENQADGTGGRGSNGHISKALEEEYKAAAENALKEAV
ncbi:AIG2-like protein [Macrophomina phaseolina MS6]|uniref:Putative gamma-glutamylcyclotransferase n=2 Tax=Macrophomina phaseolina TaxID=35725 RepID=K2RVQ0_MACPH|nr:AIG2-like protein [Macrophomina phaseolina MS6]